MNGFWEELVITTKWNLNQIKLCLSITYKIQDEDDDKVDNSCSRRDDDIGILVDDWVVDSVKGGEHRYTIEDNPYDCCYRYEQLMQNEISIK